jgi:hypothetical protein
LLRRLLSFAALPAPERGLALRAIGWLALARAALVLVSFARLRRWIESRDPPPRPAAQPDWPLFVRRAVLRAARTLPGSTCLARSLVAERLLRAGGHAARLTIGVAPGPVSGAERALDAHAWVESGGVLVAGDAELERYTQLATFGGGA